MNLPCFQDVIHHYSAFQTLRVQNRWQARIKNWKNYILVRQSIHRWRENTWLSWASLQSNRISAHRGPAAPYWQPRTGCPVPANRSGTGGSCTGRQGSRWGRRHRCPTLSWRNTRTERSTSASVPSRRNIRPACCRNVLLSARLPVIERDARPCDHQLQYWRLFIDGYMLLMRLIIIMKNPFNLQSSSVRADSLGIQNNRGINYL